MAVQLSNKPSLQTSNTNKGRYLLQKPLEPLKKTLVLDLDETLVHTFAEKPNTDPAIEVFSIHVEIVNKTLWVAKRPGVDEFLKTVSNHFEVVVFTASHKEYASLVLDYLDPENKYFHSRLYRDSCEYAPNIGYIKNLSKLGRNLSQIIIIDNSPVSYFKHPFNAIGITSWYSDPNDRQLYKCMKLLMKITQEESVYPILMQFHTANFVF